MFGVRPRPPHNSRMSNVRHSSSGTLVAAELRTVVRRERHGADRRRELSAAPIGGGGTASGRRDVRSTSNGTSRTGDGWSVCGGTKTITTNRTPTSAMMTIGTTDHGRKMRPHRRPRPVMTATSTGTTGRERTRTSSSAPTSTGATGTRNGTGTTGGIRMTSGTRRTGEGMSTCGSKEATGTTRRTRARTRTVCGARTTVG